MDINQIILITFAIPAIVAAMGLGYAALHRHWRHKERMAMIEKGIAPGDLHEAVERPAGPRSGLVRGLVPLLVGIALTLGLSTLGVGPWLLGGLVPMAWGGAVLVAHFLERGDDGDDGK